MENTEHGAATWRVIEEDDVAAMLSARQDGDTHKGDFGKLLLRVREQTLSGDVAFGGACRAALRRRFGDRGNPTGDLFCGGRKMR